MTNTTQDTVTPTETAQVESFKCVTIKTSYFIGRTKGAGLAKLIQDEANNGWKFVSNFPSFPRGFLRFRTFHTLLFQKN